MSNQLTCSECKKPKPKKAFRQLTRNPTTYSEKCLPCLHIEEEKDTKAVLKERRLDRKREQRAEREVQKLKLQNDDEVIPPDPIVKASTAPMREAIRRTLVRRRLLHFIQRFQPGYEAGWLHEDICERLEDFLERVRAGQNPRLMLFVPPRHGKSEISSKKFPAWAFGKYPDLNIIAGSYAVALPTGFSRHIRALLRDPRYQAIFPDTRLDPENQNVEGWMTTKGGIYLPAGVGGGITGKGADILDIDDPIKGAEEADSGIVREKTWDWYGSEAYTRLSPRSGVLIIQTRWHDDDLAGRAILQMKDAIKELEELEKYMLEELEEKRMPLLEKKDEIENIKRKLDKLDEEIDHWEIISYPAISETAEYKNSDRSVTSEPKDEKSVLLRGPDEALHPARFPYSRLKRIKRTLQKRHWSALYQQNPVPDEGLYFKADMFRYEPHQIDHRELDVVIAGDLAIGQKQTNDWTVFVAGVLDSHDRIHVMETLRGRWDTFGIVDTLCVMVQRYQKPGHPCRIAIEEGILDKAIMPVLKKELAKRKLTVVFVEDLKTHTDKVMRARTLQGRMQQGAVVFPQNEPWMEQVRAELLRFPGGTFDDVVDALAWLAIVLTNTAPPRKPRRRKGESTMEQRLTKIMQQQRGAHSGGGMAG